ncbi:MFS transporter [Nocardia miyunensis]|uniref:MFS transporter n=1 Tax=Nocardia miyunensis TaxID=282684 RepID=UPI0014713EDB|nr:MFS transporter [Nocardia miyunensis]
MRVYPPAAWRAAIACAIVMALSPAALIAITPFFVGPVSQQYGWAQSETLTLYSLPMIVAPLALPLAGRWVDLWGVRVVAIPCFVLYAVTTALVAEMGASEIRLGLAIGLSNMFGFMGSVGVYYKVVSEWFPHHRAVGFSVLIGATGSLAGAVYSPLGQFAVHTLGWRGTYLALGLVILLIGVPTQIFLLSEPGSRTDQPGARIATSDTGTGEPGAHTGADAPSVPLPGMSFLASLWTRRWVSVVFVIVGTSGIVAAVRQNAVALLGERGYSAGLASLSLSALMIASVIGQFVSGVALDRTRTPRAGVLFFACVPVGIAILLTAHGNRWQLMLAMCLLGVVVGAEATVGAYLVSRYFGLRAFAQVQGLTMGIGSLSIGIAPIVLQWAREHSSNYSGALVGALVIGIAVVAVALSLPRYAYPAAEFDPEAARPHRKTESLDNA